MMNKDTETTIPTRKHELETDVKRYLNQKHRIDKLECCKTRYNAIFAFFAILFCITIQYMLYSCGINLDIAGNEFAKFITAIVSIIGSITIMYFTYEIIMIPILLRIDDKLNHYQLNCDIIYNNADDDVKEYIKSLYCEGEDDDN